MVLEDVLKFCSENTWSLPVALGAYIVFPIVSSIVGDEVVLSPVIDKYEEGSLGEQFAYLA